MYESSLTFLYTSSNGKQEILEKFLRRNAILICYYCFNSRTKAIEFFRLAFLFISFIKSQTSHSIGKSEFYIQIMTAYGGKCSDCSGIIGTIPI